MKELVGWLMIVGGCVMFAIGILGTETGWFFGDATISYIFVIQAFFVPATGVYIADDSPWDTKAPHDNY